MAKGDSSDGKSHHKTTANQIPKPTLPNIRREIVEINTHPHNNLSLHLPRNRARSLFIQLTVSWRADMPVAIEVMRSGNSANFSSLPPLVGVKLMRKPRQLINAVLKRIF